MRGFTKIKKAAEIAADVIFTLILTAGAALIVLRLTGFRLLTIETPSMGSAYPVGCIAVVKVCSPDEIEVGDVISFVADEDLATVTHRVTKIDSKKRKFYTKGDANKTEDTNAVDFENLIGKATYEIPKLGYAAVWAETDGGKAVIACAFSLAAVAIGGRTLYGGKGADGGDGKSD